MRAVATLRHTLPGALCLWLVFASPAQADPLPVQVRPFSEVALRAEASATAEVRAANNSVLSAEVSARVLAVHADVGASVAKGDLLIELDPADLQLALQQSQAQVASAAARVALAAQRLARGRTLKERNFASTDDVAALATEVDAARAEQGGAEAARNIARRNVAKTRIVAPFAGAVVERQAQVGASVTPGSPLLQLIELAAAEVEAQVPVADVAELKAGVQARFHSQGQDYPVELARLAPVIERSARSQLARLRFTAEAAPIGASGSVHWLRSQPQLPASYQVQRDGQIGVFVVEAGIARFVVVPDAQAGRPFTPQLAGDAVLVSDGAQALQDGQAVRAISASVR